MYKGIQPIKRIVHGQTYYRVRVRRPALAVHIDKTFKTQKDAVAFAAELTHKLQTNDGITSNVEKSVKFKTALDRYIRGGLKKFGNKQAMKASSEATVLLRLETLCREKKKTTAADSAGCRLKK